MQGANQPKHLRSMKRIYQDINANAMEEHATATRKLDELMAHFNEKERNQHEWQVARPLHRRVLNMASNRRHTTGPLWSDIHPHHRVVLPDLTPHILGGSLGMGMRLSPAIFRVKTDKYVIE
jgi:hypothetical protein